MPVRTAISRPNRGLLLLMAGALSPLCAADVDSNALLRRVQSRALASARTVPRYYCRQYLERQVFAPTGKPPKVCDTLPPAEAGDSSSPAQTQKQKATYSLAFSDRAYLDVMLAKGTEMFSWPGGGRFATDDPGDLLGGGFTGSGDFASYLSTVFSEPQVTFQYLGACQGNCVRYSFDVPIAVSRYLVKTPVSQVTVGYHGTLDVDPQSAELLSLTVIPTGLANSVPDACDLRTQMNYTRTTLTTSEFTIPESVGKEYFSADGWYFTNRIRYTGCRQYAAESAVTFGADVPSSKADGGTENPEQHLPQAGAKLDLRLTSKVNSETSAAGDTLEAALVRAIPDTTGGMIPKGTVVRGHLAQVERIYSPKRSVTIAMRFDTIVLNGTALPVTLIPIGERDLRGRAVFQFPQPRVILDGSFTSEWRVQ